MRLLDLQIIIHLTIGLVICFSSCTKTSTETIEAELPENPFENIVIPDEMVDELAEIDSNSFVGIHQLILQPKCAQPACHDGTFEPDFRSPQSSYNTLLYQPVVKNTIEEEYSFRVLPGNSLQSWLYYRITTEDPVLGRMPLAEGGPPLSDNEITRIKNWIDNGASDIFGIPAEVTSFQPFPTGLTAYLDDFTVLGPVRVDTIRETLNGYPLPFVTLKNYKMTLKFGFNDPTPSDPENNGQDLSYNKIQFSTNPFDFSESIEMNLEKSVIPQIELNFINQPAEYYHSIQVETDQFPLNTIIYIRLLVKDEDHDAPTIIPAEYDDARLKLFFSFYII